MEDRASSASCAGIASALALRKVGNRCAIRGLRGSGRIGPHKRIRSRYRFSGNKAERTAPSRPGDYLWRRLRWATPPSASTNDEDRLHRIRFVSQNTVEKKLEISARSTDWCQKTPGALSREKKRYESSSARSASESFLLFNVPRDSGEDGKRGGVQRSTYSRFVGFFLRLGARGRA